MGNAIKPHIEHAEKSGVCNLAKQSISEFPAELLRLKNLRTLDLSENKIPSVPPPIGSFSMLKSLVLTSNRLVMLPDDIGNLKKLETLLVAKNRLSSLPSTLGKLTALRDVSFAYNNITTFPTQLGGLKHLNSVDVSHNKISVIPAASKDMQMIELNLNQNQLSNFGDGIPSCPRLKVLRVEENCLELSSFTPKLMKESQVALLAVEGNVFDMKRFHDINGYEEYMERYTATKKKFN